VGLETVRHLVFVSSYLPEPGESLSTFGADVPPPFLDFDPDGGTFGARPEIFAETFAQDCPPDIAREAAALLVRQTLAVTGQPVRAAAWHDLPTTYVVCTEDRGTPAAAQREFSRRADNVIGRPPPVPVAAAYRRRHHREPVVTAPADLARPLNTAFSRPDAGGGPGHASCLPATECRDPHRAVIPAGAAPYGQCQNKEG
jgi:hypothetical protein